MGNINRRQLLRGMAAASGLALLSGCRELIEDVAKSCPSDPAESGGVDWNPDVAHPMFWGFQDLTQAGGAPRDMRVYYPTVDGSPENAAILKLCVIRWPVVLFLHGQPPQGIPFAGYHRRWWQIPAVLARCGYVVVVPNHSAQLPTADNFPAAVTAAMNDVNWVRTQWTDREWVDKRPEATAVAGHSYGALLAARVAATRSEIAAFASLSGPYVELGNPLPVLSPIAAPSYYMWAQGDSLSLVFEDLDANGHPWDQLTTSKYAGVFQGEHFDYLSAADTGSAVRGPCSQVGAVTADLLALFISDYLKVSLSRTDVPVELTPPQVQLTQKQQFFAGAHLQGLNSFQNGSGCRLDLRWKVNGTAGNRRLGH